MRMNLKKFAAGLLAAVVLTIGLPASPAYAIDQVPCGNRTDLLKLHLDLGSNMRSGWCYANAGTTKVDLFWRVSRIDSGNNIATFIYERDGRFYVSSLDRWSHVNFVGSVWVHEVRIW
jgi:hypothetical protein